jgi:transposase
VSDGTTLLFGLPGVRVERVERRADGTRVVHVVTAEPTAAACPACGVVSTSVKGRVSTSPRDIPYGEDPIVVRWTKTRWRCRQDYCERSSFTEAVAQVPARARTTGRLRTQIGAAIGDAARSVAEVAAAHGVSWPIHRRIDTFTDTYVRAERRVEVRYDSTFKEVVEVKVVLPATAGTYQATIVDALDALRGSGS